MHDGRARLVGDCHVRPSRTGELACGDASIDPKLALVGKRNINTQVPFEAGQIGPSLSFDSEDAKTKKAEMLNCPGSDGSRHWINYPDCAVAGNH